MADHGSILAPDLPDLETVEVSTLDLDEGLQLSGVLIESDGDEQLVTPRVEIEESELRGVALAPLKARGLQFSDTILRDCDFSNVQARGGSIVRCEVVHSRLVGFDLSEGRVDDLRVADSSMTLASFARTGMQSVVFESVNLAEASFMDARMKAVAFVNCNLVGADFRGAKLTSCAIRGSSLDGLIGIDSLRGVQMPWPDILESASAMAVALGIETEEQ